MVADRFDRLKRPTRGQPAVGADEVALGQADRPMILRSDHGPPVEQRPGHAVAYHALLRIDRQKAPLIRLGHTERRREEMDRRERYDLAVQRPRDPVLQLARGDLVLPDLAGLDQIVLDDAGHGRAADTAAMPLDPPLPLPSIARPLFEKLPK